MNLGIAKYYVHKLEYVKAYWIVAGSLALTRSIINQRLQYPRLMLVTTLKRLNRRIRNRTHGGVRRGGLDSSYSILQYFCIYTFLFSDSDYNETERI